MKNNIKLYIILLIIPFVFFSGCNKNKNKCTANNEFLDVIPVNAFSKETIKLSTIAKDILYIPLESIEGHYIGFINKIFFINNRFYVVDLFEKSSVLCFDREGKFIFEINRKGKGPGEFIRMDDVEILYDQKLIAIADSEQKIVLFYDLDGVFVKKQNLPEGLYFYNFCFHSDYNVLLAGSVLLEEASKYLNENYSAKYAHKYAKLYNYITTPSNFSETYKGFKRHNILTENIKLSKPFDFFDDQIYSTYAYNDTIFQINKEVIIPKYYVDFGANKIPTELTQDDRTNYKLYHDKTLKWAGIIDNLVITGKFIGFNYSTAFKIFNSSLHIFSNEITVNYNQLKNDINGRPLGRIVGKYSDNTIINCIEAIDFVNATGTTIKNKQIVNLKNSISENDNPIIVLITIKN